MAKNEANKEGRFLGPKGGGLTTVSVLNNQVVTGGKRPVAQDGRTSYSEGVTTGAVKSVGNARPR